MLSRSLFRPGLTDLVTVRGGYRSVSPDPSRGAFATAVPLRCSRFRRLFLTRGCWILDLWAWFWGTGAIMVR